MITLYLARHGETDGNVQQWYQGSTDVPINAHGLEQAKHLGEFFSHTHLDAVYSSTLQRAMATAECVAAPHGLSVIPDESLKEADFGEWEGHTYEEITTKWPGELEAVYASDGTLPARGGESFCQVRARSLKGTRDILAKHKDGDSVFIVSHGAAIRCLLFGLLGLDMRRIWCFQQFNTAFNVVEYYGDRNVLTLLNSTRHLEGTAGYLPQWDKMPSL